MLALCSGRMPGGKIDSVKARIALLALAFAFASQLTACGGSQPSTCGVGAGRAHPEIGGQILYYCSDWPRVNGGLYVLDVASGQVRALTSDLAWNLDGAWSPDGTRIAFQSTRGGRDDIFVMDLTSGSTHRLTDGRGFNEYPSWSPDGQWIVFNSTRDGVADSAGTGYYRDLYLMRPDGTDIHRLVRHFGTFGFAAWSPDGRSLAFESDRAGTWDIYTMAADGGSLEQLTHHETTGGSAGFASWSPDGSRIVYGAVQAAGQPALIYWLAVGQDLPHRVTDNAPGLQYDGYPDWSSAGWVVFVRNRGDNTQLFAVRPDGTHLTQLTSGPGNKVLPRWRPA